MPLRAGWDRALAETIDGSFKAEVIHRRGPWRSIEAVEYATLERVDWLTTAALAASTVTVQRDSPQY